MRRNLQIAVASLMAIAFAVLLYPYTFRAWFQADDLGWLGLEQHVVTWHDWLVAMFAPMAQGTIRPLSERAFYLAGSSRFGLNALPFRVIVFALQAGSIVLLGLIARTLMKSAMASFWAPVLWMSNIALAALMTWTGSCSEVFCTLFLLSAFYSFLLSIQTGKRRYAILHWIFYLLAMGALEITVMYPVAVTAYAWLFARSHVKRVLGMFVPSVVYAIVHEAVRTPPKTHVYDLHFDFSMVTTFVTYVKLALGPGAAFETFPSIPVFVVVVASAAIAAGLIAFVWHRFRAGDKLPLFGLIWFVVFLGPFLPVRDHITNYYLTIPSLGLALAAASAIVAIPTRGWFHRAATIACTLLYFGFSIPTTRADSKAWWARSMPVKKLVLGVRDIHQRSPDKLILLDGVSDQLFWMAVYDHPFRLYGAGVLMTTETGAKLHPYPELGNIADYTIPRDRMNAELKADRAIVYSAGGDTGELRNITALFKAAALDNGTPRRIEIGHPPIDSLLGPTWYPSEGEFRWMPAEATVRLGGPPNGHGAVRVRATCAPIQLPLTVTVSVDGSDLSPPFEIEACDAPLTIERAFQSPRGEIEVKLRVSRTIHVGADTRDLGLAVRVVEVVP